MLLCPDHSTPLQITALGADHREEIQAVLQMRGSVELVPAARRLMSSLRDMGYEFTTAVADLVDNSVAAGATRVTVDIEYEGENSWVRIADNGSGMSAEALREAMRYGSSRRYADEDLGKFGLGMKVASLSQCRRLTVASRTNPARADIHAYCWDLEHIERTNRWELLPIAREKDVLPPYAVLDRSVGTVVVWERLDRILGFQDPGGESARRRLAYMSRDVEGHLSMVFHRFLSGEARGRRKLQILVNGHELEAWDPFARDEPGTRKLKPTSLPVIHGDMRGELTLEPFILPHQSEFSTADNFRRASGPSNWNQQQGFYVYRSDRLIQSGGWCRIRTLDEHTKLARIALRFSPQLDEAFRVNVSKMRVQLPVGMREQITEVISPVTKMANDAYRRTSGKAANRAGMNGADGYGPEEGRSPRRPSPARIEEVVTALLTVAKGRERGLLRRLVSRLEKAE